MLQQQRKVTTQEKVYNLVVELIESKQQHKEAKERVKLYADNTKRIQAEIDELVAESEGAENKVNED